MEYTNPFTGATISPSQVGYIDLTISANTYLEWPINGNDTVDVAANIIEVTATTGGLELLMPPAAQVSVGQAVIIRNIGSNPFTVTNNGGGTLLSVNSGVAYYLYLTDNSTVNGTWSNVTFGAGTSAADAATLAGYGLTAIGPTLNQSYSVTNYYASSALTATARAQFAVWQGGAGTLTLPSASAVGANWFCMFRNNGSGILTIAPVGSDTIDGNVSDQLQITESFVVVSNGSGWNTFGYGQATQFAFTQLSVVVTGGTLTETASQASNLIQEFTGTLTSNQIVIVPPTVQLYTVTNNTLGSFSFTVKTSAIGAAVVNVPQGTSLLLICDGTNVYNAASGSSSSITSLTLGNGSLSTPSLKFTGDANTGLYLPASSNLSVVVANALAATFSSTGLAVPNGIGGGSF